MMKPVSTEIYPYSTYSLTCWTRLQTSVSLSIFTRSEPDWASICLHQGFSPQKLEGSVAFCYWQSLSTIYTRDGLEFFSCLSLCCLVLFNNKQFHFIMLHHSISRNKITWAAFKQLRTDEDYKYSSLSNWQSQLVQGWGRFIWRSIVICQYVRYFPPCSSSFPSPPRHSSSPSSYHLTYRSSSLPFVSSSSVLCSILCHGSIPPLLCSEHHSSILWLDYLTLTSLHFCG